MISVLVTSYNQIDKLKVTIESLLNQKTKYSYEIIISDDHSNDGSFKFLKSLESDKLVLSQPKSKKKVGNNRNHLISLASKKYSIFVDGDDPQDLDFIDKICMSIEDDDVYNLVGFKEVWDDKIIAKKTTKYFNIFLNVYKTKYLKELKFNAEINIGEDVIFTLENYDILRNKNNKKVFVYYMLNRSTDNSSLTKNGNYSARFKDEIILYNLMLSLKNDYPKSILNEKRIDLINFSILSGEEFNDKIDSLSGLDSKHKISYLMYKCFPKKIYKKIIVSKLGHKV